MRFRVCWSALVPSEIVIAIAIAIAAVSADEHGTDETM